MATFTQRMAPPISPSTGAYSLGEALGNALGGPTPLQKLQIDKFRAGLDEMAARKAHIESQTEYQKQKTAGEVLANENAGLMRGYAHDAADAAGRAIDARVVKPPLVLNSDAPAIVQYRQDYAAAEAAKAQARYGYGVGDGNPSQRADAANALTGGNMIQFGSPDQARRGAAIMGHNPGVNDYFGTGDTGPIVGAQADALKDYSKPHFFDDGRIIVRPDQNDPSGWNRRSVGGVDPNDSLYGKGEIDSSMRVLSMLNQKLSNGQELSPEERDAYSFHHMRVFPNNREIDVGDRKFLTNANPDSASRFPSVNDVFNGRGPAPVPVPPGGNPGLPPEFQSQSGSPLIDMLNSGRGPAPVVVEDPRARGGAPRPLAPVPGPGAGGRDASQQNPLIPPGALDLGAQTNKPLTQEAGRAQMFSKSMLLAEQTLSQTRVPAEAPGVLDQLSNAPNKSAYITILNKAMSDPSTQEYFQAAEAYVTNYLRQTSGATIGDPEYQRTFNWMIGTGQDNPRTLAQKKAQRDTLTLTIAAQGFGPKSPEFNSMVRDLDRINRGEQVFNFGSSSSPSAPSATSAASPTPSATSAAPSITVDAIRDLRKNPALRNDFDAAYGPGSAAAILGE